MTEKTKYQIIGVLIIAGLLLTAGPVIAGFSPLAAVAMGWMWFALPGFPLTAILLRRVSWVARIPIAFVLGIGLATLYTVPAILLRLKLDYYLGLSIGTLLLTMLIFLRYESRNRPQPDDGQDSSPETGYKFPEADAGQMYVYLSPQIGHPEAAARIPEVRAGKLEIGMAAYLGLLVVAVGALVVLALRWPPAGDDLAGLPFFAESLRVGRITGTEPHHGTGTPVTPRNELIVTGYQSVLVAKLSGTAPDVFLVNSRPVLIIIAILALYTFLYQYFKNRHLALFLLSLWVIFLLATTQVEGTGSDFVTRIVQDKFFGWFIVVPIVLVFMLWFLESHQRRYLAGFGLVAFGATLMHPITLTQVMVLGGSFGALYLVAEHSRRAFRDVVLIALVLVLCLVVPVFQYIRFMGRMPIEEVGLNDVVEFARTSQAVTRYRLWLLNGNRYILHPAIILQPVILLGFLFAPLLVLHLRKSNAARLIVASMVAMPLLLYVPPLAALAGKFVTPYLLWRLAWPLPLLAILAIGWLVWRLVSGPASLVSRRSLRASNVILYAGLLTAVALALVIARPNIKEGLVNFEERRSAQEFTTCATARDALHFLDDLAHDEYVNVLASRQLNFCIPGLAPLANVVEFRGYGTVNRLPIEQVDESLQRVQDATYFNSVDLVDDLVVAAIERQNIDYVMVEKDRIHLDLQIRHLPQLFTSVYADRDYALYAVTKPLPASPIVDGNAALRQRRWAEAQRIFSQVLQEDAGQILAQLGLGMAQEGMGDLDAALASYLAASAGAADEPALHAWLAETYLLMRDAKRVIEEYEQAVTLAPRRYALYTSLGIAQYLAGDEDAARDSFARSVSLLTPEGTATYYSILGNTVMSAHWASEAVRNYRSAIAIEPDARRYVELAEALFRSDDVTGAIQASQEAIELDPWFDLPHLQLASIYESEDQLEDAVQEYERAWRLNPVNHNSFTGLGQAIRARTGIEAAIERLEDLMTLNDILPGPYRATAILHAVNGETDAALKELAHSAVIQDRDAGLKVTTADFLLRNGQLDEAAQVYEEALELNRDLISARVGIATLYARDAEFGLQIGELLRAARSNASASSPRLSLAAAYRVLGKWQAAQAEAEWAIKLESDKPVGYVALGLLYSFRANWEAAIAACEQAIEVEPTDTDAFIQLGQIYQALGDLETAREYLERAAELEPDLPGSWVTLGDLYRREGDLTGAIAQYQRAIEVEPGYVVAHVALGNALQASGHLTESIAALQRAIEVEPASPDSYIALSQIARTQGKTDEALDWLEKAVKANASAGRAFAALAAEYERRGAGESAIQAYEQAIAAEPSLTDAYIQLATLHEALGNFAAAEEQFRAATQAVPGAGMGWVGLGSFYARRGEHAKAIDIFQQAQEIEPTRSEAYAGLAKLYQTMGRRDEASAQYQIATQVNPGSSSAWTALGDYYQNQNEVDSALAAYQQAVEVEPGNVLAWLALGNAFRVWGKVDQAEEVYQHALALQPGNAEIYLAMGRSEEVQGMVETAEELYQQATDLAPAAVRSHLRLGAFYNGKGEQDKALAELEEAAAVAPVSAQALVALGDWHRVQGNRELAERIYRQAMQVAPTEVDGYVALGQLEEERANFTAAELLYRQAAEIAPTRPDGYLSLGSLYAVQYQPEQAQAAFEAAVDVAPSSAQTLVTLGNWYQVRGDRELAEKAYRRALEMDPTANELGWFSG